MLNGLFAFNRREGEDDVKMVCQCVMIVRQWDDSSPRGAAVCVLPHTLASLSASPWRELVETGFSLPREKMGNGWRVEHDRAASHTDTLHLTCVPMSRRLLLAPHAVHETMVNASSPLSLSFSLPHTFLNQRKIGSQ